MQVKCKHSTDGQLKKDTTITTRHTNRTRHEVETSSSFTKLELNNHTYENKFKQGALVHFEELLVPYRNVICPLLLVFVILGRWGVIFVMSAPLNHLWEKQTHTTVIQIQSSTSVCKFHTFLYIYTLEHTHCTFTDNSVKYGNVTVRK